MLSASICNKVLHGDAATVLSSFPDESIDVVFTSPSPYGFGGAKGIGSEDSQFDYLDNLTSAMTQVKRVLKDDGSCYVHLGDTHLTTGGLSCTPEHFVVRMGRMGWLKRSSLAWIRTEKFEMQEDYDRYARDWENVYLFTKTNKNFFNNPRCRVVSSVFKAPYYAPRKKEFESGFPERLIEWALVRSCPHRGIVLDPLAGTGTTGLVAKRLGFQYVLIELDEDKVHAMRARLRT